MLVQSFSGIRGVYPKDFNEDIARRYAYVFYEFLKKSKEPLIVIGTDTRASSDSIKEALLDVFFDIIDVGVMPVAAVELAVREYKADGGIYITASHNPPGYNGLKFLDKDGAVLRPADIDVIIRKFEELKKLSERDFLNSVYKEEDKLKVKKIKNKDVYLVKDYAKFISKVIGKLDNRHKVIVDVNGGAGIVLEEILAILKIKNIKIINGRQGRFVREIEPNEKSLKYLNDIIKREKAQFAAGFDCDADRVEFVLKDGSIVNGDYLLALIVDDVLKGQKCTVVVNDATSNIIKEIAEKHKCEVEEVEVGEINVVDAMLRFNTLIGGEGSNGGVIFRPSRCRDGILSLLYLLKIISKNKKSLEQLIKELPKYYTLQNKIKTKKPVNKERIKDYYLKKNGIIRQTGDETGGLKIIADKKSFVWFRASKTEDRLFRIIVDSDSLVKSKRLMAEAVSLVKQ